MYLPLSDFSSSPAPASVTTAINTLSGAPNPNALSDEEKKRILEEENRRMEELRVSSHIQDLLLFAM